MDIFICKNVYIRIYEKNDAYFISVRGQNISMYLEHLDGYARYHSYRITSNKDVPCEGIPT